MRRILLRSIPIPAFSLLCLLSMIWGVSFFVEPSQAHLRITTTRSMGDNLHLTIRDGDVSFFDQFDVDSRGAIQPLVVDPRTQISPKIRGTGRCTIPGFDLRYCRFVDGYLVWSLRMSLLIPIAVLLVGFVVSRRLQKPSATTDQDQAHEPPHLERAED